MFIKICTEFCGSLLKVTHHRLRYGHCAHSTSSQPRLYTKNGSRACMDCDRLLDAIELARMNCTVFLMGEQCLLQNRVNRVFDLVWKLFAPSEVKPPGKV